MTDAMHMNCPEKCPTHAVYLRVLPWMLWLLAALSALAIESIPYDFDESICGVWGCFHPVQALAAMHLFWLVLFAAGVWAVKGIQPVLLRASGALLVAFTALVAAALLREDLARWLEFIPDSLHQHWPKRIAYVLATSIDRPLLQALLAGTALFVLSFRKRIQPGCHIGTRGDSIVPTPQENL